MKMLLIYVSILVFLNSPSIIVQAEEEPAISSEAAILIDSKTGEVLFEKNSNKRMYPASLTKIATAIYAIEKGNLNDIVTVGKNARVTEGTRVYLEEGETVNLQKLIQGMLINSGNDAGVAIAEHLSGSNERFSKELNMYLADLGLKETNFKNPHGLYDPEHVTTAEDLAFLTRYAMENSIFREIFGTKELKWKGVSWDTTLYTHHKLMREFPYEGVIGGKTGYVDQSGHTLVTAAQRKDLSLIAVTLKAPSQEIAYNDTMKLLDFGFNNFKTSSLSKGTDFQINNIVYNATTKLYITQSTQSNVLSTLKDDGKIEILYPSAKLLSDIQLGYAIKKNKEVKKIVKQSTNQKDEKLAKGSYIFGTILITLLVSVIVLGNRTCNKIAKTTIEEQL
ncbi:D-alanyl-D-alanine carboxypeptidase (plasmid) [Cytobacillus firmus]|nr:D-alanyl-D-alanine carboxypeptidase family protein [Bacillus sp. NTK034]MBN8202711.1 D-alanyl-D-alanine carboxypeptidase [Bacillus sp. NTK034]